MNWKGFWRNRPRFCGGIIKIFALMSQRYIMKYFSQYIRCQVEIRTKQLSNARLQPHLNVYVSDNVHIF